jgi:alkylation response protein AidB-like acyl-CoA dehydrogenase
MRISNTCACRSLEISIKYAKEREQFGQPIANFQFIQAKVANMYVDLEAVRLCEEAKRTLLAFFMAFLFMLLQHGTCRYLFSALTRAPAFFGFLFDMLVLSLFLITNTFQMFFLFFL